MRSYATATAFRRALEDRLAVMAKAEGTDLQRMRRQVSFDRLLVRLFHVGNPPWCLKGGYALELKLSMARTTRDIDLGMSSSLPPGTTLLEALQSSAGYDAGDHFVFVIGEPVMDLDGAPYGGARHPVDATLDGRSFARSFRAPLAGFSGCRNPGRRCACPGLSYGSPSGFGEGRMQMP